MTKVGVPIEVDEVVAIEVDELQCSLADSEGLCMSTKCCIFKTPEILSRHNPKAYIPNAFSIGPIHHHNENLKPTHKIKLKYLQVLIRRSRSQNPQARLTDFIREISKIEKEARKYYGGLRGFDDSKKFVEMLVIDGCFLIELFRKDIQQTNQKQQQEEDNEDDHDPVFGMSCMLQFLRHDLILLENQIPWIVLEKLFEMTKQDYNNNKSVAKLSLVKLAIECFGNIFSSDQPPINESQFKNKKIKHILDLLRIWLVAPICPNSNDEDLEGETFPFTTEKEKWETFPSTTEIEKAGITFKSKKKAKSILDISFENGVLEIPSLLIQETTETILRNLISFEQCCPNCAPIVTSYATVLDKLINTEKDVKILCENNIIDSWLNPKDITEFFNKLYLDAYVKEFYYFELCKNVTKYRKRFLPKFRAFYVHHFGTPLAIVSQIVGAIILVLTFLQTLYSILK